MRIYTLLSFIGILVYTQSFSAESMVRERLLMDSGWRFQLGHASDPSKDFEFGLRAAYSKAGDPGGPANPGFDDTEWRLLDLPHDWVVELPFDDKSDLSHGFKPVGIKYPGNSIGWYRRSFNIPKEDFGKRITLEMDGVFRDSLVWVNGHEVGGNESGYSSFQMDITDVLNYGDDNVLVVRVDASHFEGWFYEGAGIYRHVWLVKTAPLHIAHWGTFISSEVKKAQADISCQTEILNEDNKAVEFDLTSEILDSNGNSIMKISTSKISVNHWSQKVLKQKFIMPNPNLWSLENPYLYKMLTRIFRDNKEIDRYETPFGIRTIHFDPDKGFFLNGKQIYIKGTCNHQDHAGVGSALPDRIQYFRIEKLKEMGCNAYRTSHNAPTPELLEACDKLGMLVMDEQRLVGSSPEILSQLERMIKRDRNHPSIILWSIGNEEWNIQGSDIGERLAASMYRTIKNLDSTRPVTAAMNGNWGQGFSNIIDIQGCNYLKHGNYDEFHKKFPQKPMIGTEEASTLATRGIYSKDIEKGYVSAYDVNNPSWGMTAEGWWTYYQARPYIAGAFVWTGFDYRGEPTPYGWPCINSHFGILDVCGFPKDTFYYYQSWWSDKTVLHLLPHWNWKGKEGETISVRCFSNCDEVELFLNGNTLGKKTIPLNSHLQWDVKYTPGILLAKGFKEGREISSDKIETTTEPVTLQLIPDRKVIQADGQDVSMITVKVLDSKERLVPMAVNEIHFDIQGEGKIIGVGNGNPSSHEPDKYLDTPNFTNRSITGWKIKFVENENVLNEIAQDYDDTAWQDIQVDEPLMNKENAVAVYRSSFDLSSSDLASPQLLVKFSGIDDLGWIYLNGQKLGETYQWNKAYNFDIASKARIGKNALAVLVRNHGGPGGIWKGVKLTMNHPTTPAKWKRKVFNGLAQLIVQSTTNAGDIQLTAISHGLTRAIVVINSTKINYKLQFPN